MSAIGAARLVLIVFALAALLLPFAIRAKYQAGFYWLVFGGLALFAAPIGGTAIRAAVFVVTSWTLAVLFALSAPTAWLGSTSVPLLPAWLVIPLAFAVPLFLKGFLPDRLWLGLGLAFVLGPAGQLYADPEGPLWFTVVWTSAVLVGLVWQLVTIGSAAPSAPLQGLPAVWLGWEGLIFHVASALLMYVRIDQGAGSWPTGRPSGD